MSTEKWEAFKRIKSNPTCVFCDVITQATTIFRINGKAIRGWICPNCGFTLIHPGEIPKAMEFAKQTMRIV